MNSRDDYLDARRLAAQSFVKHVDYHESVTSTNDLALELAGREDLATPTLVVAERQSAGRGRGSNRWWSAAGGVTFSLVFEPGSIELDPQRWPQISLTAAVAVCTALETFASDTCWGVKWPNDVHADGRKICGILVEVPNTPALAARRVVLGMGLNVNNSWQTAPDELREVGTALCDLTTQGHDRTEVLLAVLSELEQRLTQLGNHDPRLGETWSRLCVLRGRRVTILQGETEVSGTCEGINHQGALVLQTPRGAQRIFGGTVVAAE
jgi:BirA family biotin operon repressor/biotin-[acetyl-CoA-carboxylase] ligase